MTIRRQTALARRVLACGWLGSLVACSGVPRSDWYDRDGDSSDPAVTVEDSTSTAATSDESEAETTSGEGSTTTPTKPPPTPSDPTESDGYTPVLNPDGSVARPMQLSGEAFNTRFARLTTEQWQNAARDLLRLPSLPVEESQFFENIGAGATDFVNDQSRLQMSNTQRAQYQLAAEKLAKRVGQSDATLQTVYQGTDPESFVRAFGLRAFRRPLSSDEVQRYLTVFEAGTSVSGDQSDFTKGASLVIEVMLQSPHFLYRTEVGKAGAPLSGYEKAAKLSLYLLRTTPSDALLAKAAAGELDSTSGLLAEAKGMLETDEAARTFLDFHTELYELHRFKGITKSDPAFTEDVASELVAASEAFFDRVYRKDYGLHEILTTRRGFVGPATAPLYGISPAPTQLSEVLLPEERAGFFTQLPYLTYFARDSQSYGILRGVHINTEVLCAQLPPLNTPVPPLPEVEYTTSREYMEKGTVCGGACHSEYINPLGFSMENFDGLGRSRKLDNGVPVDTTGYYPFVGGKASFGDAVELMDLISENQMAHECYSRYLASYGLGRTLGATDYSLVRDLAQQSLIENASTKELVLALVASPAFSTHQGVDP